MFIPDVSGAEHGAIGAKATMLAGAKAVAAKSQFVQTPAQPLSAIDTNGDEQLDYHDCPHPGGSAEAKNWFNTVMSPYVKAQATPEMKALHGEKCVAMFNGKPIIAGAPTVDGGDYDYTIQKLILTKGMTPETATAFAAKVKATAVANLAARSAAVK
jgi:hypothetical protein